LLVHISLHKGLLSASDLFKCDKIPRMAAFSYSNFQIANLLAEFDDPNVREAVELTALPEILRDANYFIDVGANVGQYTFHAAKHLRKAKLIAIEANPYLIPTLKQTVENLRLHDSHENEFEIHPAAVSDEPGTLNLYVSGIPTLSSVFPNSAHQALKVRSVRLDDFFLPSMHTVIKIDIEGAEYRAVSSAIRFLQSNNTAFFVELHGWGDKVLGKYPIHVCWLFLKSGYGIRKVGTHYLFRRMPRLPRIASFLEHGPHLGLKYMLFRFAPNLHSRLLKLRTRT
jgi:FkbM family methyltransferase